MPLFEGISLAITAGRELIDLPALGPSELLAMKSFSSELVNTRLCSAKRNHSTSGNPRSIHCASTLLGPPRELRALLQCGGPDAVCAAGRYLCTPKRFVGDGRLGYC